MADIKPIFFDIECYPTFFCAVFKNEDTTHIFKDNYKELKAFLSDIQKKGYTLVGFNNHAYDNIVLDKMMQLDFRKQHIEYDIYNISTSTIGSDFSLAYITVDNKRIETIDLYKTNHFDRTMTSLKELSVFFNYDNIEETPFSFNRLEEFNEYEKEQIINYCEQDVNVLVRVWEYSSSRIELRKDIDADFKKYSWSDVKMGKMLFISELSKETKIPIYDLLKPNEVDFSGIRLDKTFKVDYRELSNKLLFTETKSKFLEIVDIFSKAFNNNFKLKYNFIYNNKTLSIPIVFGSGGLHACVEGKYTLKEDEVFIDLDVTSLYPSIAINYLIAPRHKLFTKEQFIKVYSSILERRIYHKKMVKQTTGEESKKHNKIQEQLKFCANGLYGLLKSQGSPVYDPVAQLEVVINGQLLILYLFAMIVDSIDCQVIQINTDGLTIKLNKKHLKKLEEIIQNWQNITKLNLEEERYKQIFIRDVNNYIMVKENNSLKLKGDYDYSKYPQKNNSNKFSTLIAVKSLVENKNVKTIFDSEIQDIIDNNNIDKFHSMLIYKKKNSNSFIKWCYYKDNYFYDEKISNKLVRYLVGSNQSLYFQYNSGKIIRCEANRSLLLLNKIDSNNIESYINEIDREFYIAEAIKLTAMFNQLNVF